MSTLRPRDSPGFMTRSKYGPAWPTGVSASRTGMSAARAALGAATPGGARRGRRTRARDADLRVVDSAVPDDAAGAAPNDRHYGADVIVVVSVPV